MATKVIKSAPSSKATAFRYIALGGENELVEGTIRATNEAMAGRLLVQRGLKPVTLDPIASKFSLDQMFPSLFSIKTREVCSFSRQLATLIESGITMLPALELIHQRTSKRALKRVLAAIIDDIRSGHSLSQALSKHSTIFSEIYCRTVALAEQTGNLETILRQMADYLEKQGEATKRIKNALVYPSIIMSLGIVVVIILMTTALPSMINMFDQAGSDLPLPTRILIAVTDFVNGHKLHLMITAGLLVVLAVWLPTRPRVRLWLDGLILRAPAVGPSIHSAEIGHFSRTTSVLLAAGLTLQEIMEMIPSTVKNLAMRRSLTKVNQDLIRGEGISMPMAEDNIFPSLLTQMVTVGEETNTLESSLGVAADFYEMDAVDKTNSLVRIIQPAAIVFVALLVGFIALAVIMPMYSLTGSFQ
ncbi:type II secretion system F family protein [Chloroflexota bacterium]